MSRYIPPGYISIEQAIYRMAFAIAPYLWSYVPQEERRIWQDTVLNFRGDALLTELLGYLKRSDVIVIDNPRLRYIFFRAALLELRERLHSGDVVAYSFDQELRFGRIRAKGWIKPDLAKNWADGVIPILESGFNKATGRHLFLFEPDLCRVESELLLEGRVEPEKEGRGFNIKMAEQVLRSIHQTGDLWPGLSETWETVKAVPDCANLTRDQIDDLRRSIDSEAVRKRGRPKKNPEAN